MKLAVNEVSVAIDSRRIVEEIDLHVEPGEIVGLIGPNGSGKSTLLRSVYRLLKPVAGYVQLGEDDVWKLSARESARRTGVVVQETPSDFDFTVREVVEMGRTPHKGLLEADNARDAQLVQSALERVNMTAFAGRSFNTLSGGEKQRVLVARALACEPQILILDEPTANIDMRVESDIFDLLRVLNQRMTILVVSHDVAFISAYVRRVACVNRTLLCHATESIDGQVIHDLYGGDVRRVAHVHAH